MILLAGMSRKNSDVRARFAQRLRAIRIPRGYKTARSFAQALEIDENRYTRYERAEVEPDLRLLMRICTLLGATPNDLLCDTIGVSPMEVETPYGFAEKTMGSYQTQPAPYASSAPPATVPVQTNGVADARKAVGFQLAEAIATTEAMVSGVDGNGLTPLEKLRRTVPIAARIESDAFQFLADLPNRFASINVPSERQVLIDRLIQELIVAHKPGHNDND